MPSFAVIGASRGIGLEYVRQLAIRPDSLVFAVARSATAPLLLSLAETHKNVHVIGGDVVDHRSLERAAVEIAKLSGGSLDVLIHNAARIDSSTILRGFDDYKDLDELDTDLIDAFKVNTLGVVHSITAFLPLLRKGVAKKIVVIGTTGSVPSVTMLTASAGMAAYTTTKAAAIMVATKYAARLKDEGFTVVSINPGVVDTSKTADDSADFSFQATIDGLKDLGITVELQTPEQSVARQLQVIDVLRPEQNGAFLEYTGDAVTY
ncbi:NAD-P-binding protein [Trametes meyenii]|nr:NAD-P-binding protein [Trametes meyenii]